MALEIEAARGPSSSSAYPRTAACGRGLWARTAAFWPLTGRVPDSQSGPCQRTPPQRVGFERVLHSSGRHAGTSRRLQPQAAPISVLFGEGCVRVAEANAEIWRQIAVQLMRWTL
jgi:hypothetical protein